MGWSRGQEVGISERKKQDPAHEHTGKSRMCFALRVIITSNTDRKVGNLQTHVNQVLKVAWTQAMMRGKGETRKDQEMDLTMGWIWGAQGERRYQRCYPGIQLWVRFSEKVIQSKWQVLAKKGSVSCVSQVGGFSLQTRAKTEIKIWGYLHVDHCFSNYILGTVCIRHTCSIG